jgi:hypothetical protein
MIKKKMLISRIFDRCKNAQKVFIFFNGYNSTFNLQPVSSSCPMPVVTNRATPP